MELYNEQTDHSSKDSKVYLEGNKMYQITTDYRDIANEKQLSKIVENLTLDKGYIMGSQRINMLELVNPKEPETVYWIYTEQQGICKETKTFIGEVEL